MRWVWVSSRCGPSARGRATARAGVAHLPVGGCVASELGSEAPTRGAASSPIETATDTSYLCRKPIQTRKPVIQATRAASCSAAVATFAHHARSRVGWAHAHLDGPRFEAAETSTTVSRHGQLAGWSGWGADPPVQPAAWARKLQSYPSAEAIARRELEFFVNRRSDTDLGLEFFYNALSLSPYL